MPATVVWDEIYLSHDTGQGHPESPARLKAIGELLTANPSLKNLKPRLATPEEVSCVHTLEHVEEVAQCQGHFGFFDGDTPYGPHSSRAAFMAVGGVLQAIEEMEAGRAKEVFCFPRPPGHHAEAERAMGFCLFNNIAIGAETLVKKYGRKKVAIVDIDVHHGNGTQNFFYSRPDVFYVSTHQYPFYPGTGSEKERGIGEGLGKNLNVEFSSGEGDEEFKQSYDEIIVPALDAFAPEVLLVSAGFDAHERDPLGGLKVTQAGFYQMAKDLMALSQRHCGGKILFVLEGGYDLRGLREGVEAVLEVID